MCLFPGCQTAEYFVPLENQEYLDVCEVGLERIMYLH